MARRTRAPNEAAPIVEARRGRPATADEDRLNHQIQSALRQAAEVRETRDRARSNEDDRSYRQATEALQALIQGDARARVG